MSEKIIFHTSAFKIEELPKNKLPEILLCGRSNVGKSSFINTLYNKKNIARSSSTPGKTVSINYYLIEDKFFIVDTPGYGFAKRRGKAKSKVKWADIIEHYFMSGRNIVSSILIIDSRILNTELDDDMYAYLKNMNIPIIVLVNKIDKLNQSEMAKAKNMLIATFPELTYGVNLFFFSAEKGTNKDNISKMIKHLLK